MVTKTIITTTLPLTNNKIKNTLSITILAKYSIQININIHINIKQSHIIKNYLNRNILAKYHAA